MYLFFLWKVPPAAGYNQKLAFEKFVYRGQHRGQRMDKGCQC